MHADTEIMREGDVEEREGGRERGRDGVMMEVIRVTHISTKTLGTGLYIGLRKL